MLSHHHHDPNHGDWGHEEIFDPDVGVREGFEGGEDVWDHGVECWAVVHEENRHIALPVLQMGQCSVTGDGDGILCGLICSVSKLVVVKGAG